MSLESFLHVATQCLCVSLKNTSIRGSNLKSDKEQNETTTKRSRGSLVVSVSDSRSEGPVIESREEEIYILPYLEKSGAWLYFWLPFFDCFHKSCTAMSMFSTLLRVARLVSVEPYLFLCMLGYAGRMVCFQNLLMDRWCRKRHNESVCDNLDEHLIEKAECIEGGNNLYMGVMLSSSFPAIAVALFLGPWSDKHSRKLPLVMASCGMCLDSFAGAVLAAFPQAAPLWFVATALLSGFSGGIIICMSASFCYLSDILEESSRPARFSVLDSFGIAALVLGNVAGGQICEKLGHAAAMAVSPVCFAFATIYSLCLVKETKKTRAGDDVLRDLFLLDNLLESYKTCSRKRPGNQRKQIWMLAWINFCQQLCNMGMFAVGYPFARSLYQWSVGEFTNATTAFYVVNALVTLVILPFLSKGLRLQDATIGFIAMMSSITKVVLNSVAYKDYMFYIAWMSGTLANGVQIAVRSRLSKLVRKEEIGCAFSLLGTLESVTPLLGSLVFLQLYNATQRFFTGFAFAAAAVFLIPCAAIFVWMMQIPTIPISELTEIEQMNNLQCQQLKPDTAPPFAKYHEESIDVHNDPLN
ncbi:hypothetical protein JTE90_002090 [Oedothorax gibbosus]|uniref:Proton-coupled folate transporter n=1 Tax=Oedothorax gibbosus TaxID=931172 RepID=A0AAV6UEQ2_9ARAC|nr:hypothetical protein JTE90_002090 [Oedothorax gibbosus]